MGEILEGSRPKDAPALNVYFACADGQKQKAGPIHGTGLFIYFVIS
jgi:hypothetical protein